MVNSVPTKKSLGQHWLNDSVALHSMVRAGNVQPGTDVLEIGPGTGTLTEVLLDAGANVIAIEQDDRLIEMLGQKFNGRDFRIEHIDILKLDLTALPANYTVVANIPYYLTSKLIRTLLESTNPPLRTVILVQKEVAERVAAVPGKMSLLSVASQFYATVELDMVVPARLFEPRPKVDSQILVLDRREEALFNSEEFDKKLFFRIIKAGFSSRRKTLLNSLSGGLRMPKVATEKALRLAEVPPTIRPQELSIEKWHDIYLEYKKYEQTA
ncbi:ribosomal RNA small subunit methyltransferase A [Candidatus Saccharibacteria bacterium]|nr:ribosomal RNA small subunit methyltransferase A [Candidatus Saccharibacteria bacterium]